MFISLNLPHPNSFIINYVENILQNLIFQQRKINWCEQMYGSNNLYADYEYYTDNTIVKLIQQQFQQYFLYNIKNVYLILMESYDNKPRVMPPHTDKHRRTAINFYTRLGGDTTRLILYEKYGSTDLDNSELSKYEDLIVHSKNNLNALNWYAFNPKQFHSIENVTSKRLCIGLFFVEPFDQFLEDHSKILVS